MLTDYNEWLAQASIDLGDITEVCDLYRALHHGKGYTYRLVPFRGNLLLAGPTTKALILTEKARKAFIKHLDAFYADGVETQFAWEQALSGD